MWWPLSSVVLTIHFPITWLGVEWEPGPPLQYGHWVAYLNPYGYVIGTTGSHSLSLSSTSSLLHQHPEYTVPGLETDRWKCYNCIIPKSCRALRFFLFVCMCLLLVLTKFQCPKTLTFCLRSFVRYRTKVQVTLFEKQKLTSLELHHSSEPQLLELFPVCLSVSRSGTDKISSSWDLNFLSEGLSTVQDHT